MSPASCATLHSLNVALYGIQSDVPHGNSKSVFPGEPGLVEGNRTAERRLQRERGTPTNVRVNELFKLAVHGRVNRQRDALVRSGVQFRRPVIGVKDVIGEIGQRK